VLEAIRKARIQCDLLVISIHWGIEYAPAPRSEDVETAHRMLDAGASVIVGHHPHVLQPVETYRTADGRSTVIFYSLGNFLSNQSRSYVDGLMPDREGDPRDSMIGLFSAVRKDYGPGGIRVELGHVGVLPAWGENNRNELAAGYTKPPVIHPVLIDREIPRTEARLDELNKLNTSATPLSAAQKQEFIELTNQMKLLDDRRKQIVARLGDEYITDPPRLAARPLASLKHQANACVFPSVYGRFSMSFSSPDRGSGRRSPSFGLCRRTQARSSREQPAPRCSSSADAPV